MNDYISRGELRKHLKACYTNDIFDADMRKATFAIDCYVKNMPAADVQSVKNGMWRQSISCYGFIVCSECKHEAYWDTEYGQQLFDYCPYCGARMMQEGETK